MTSNLQYTSGTVTNGGGGNFYNGTSVVNWTNGDVMQIGSNSSGRYTGGSSATTFTLTLSGAISASQLIVSSNLSSGGGNQVIISDNGSSSNTIAFTSTSVSNIQNESTTNPLVIDAQIIAPTSAALTVSGIGTVIFEENNTGVSGTGISKGVTIESATGDAGAGGTLQIGNGSTTGSLGTGTVTITTITGQTSASALDYDLSGAASVSNAITINSTTGGGPSTLGGIIEQSGGGTLNFSGGVANSTTGATTFNINGSIGTTDTTESGNITGTGGLTKSGTGELILSGTGNTYTGTTTISTGTLLANSASGTATGYGSISVANGATLGGSGMINPGGNSTSQTISFASGGILAPGTSGNTDTLTVSAASNTHGSGLVNLTSATLSFNLNRTLGTNASSQLSLTSAFSSEVTGLSGNTLTFNDLSSGNLQGVYNLIVTNDSAANPFSGLAANTPLNGFTIQGLSAYSGDSIALEVVNTYNGSNYALQLDITPQSVPEPSTLVLLAAGLAGTFFCYRRKIKVTRFAA